MAFTRAPRRIPSGNEPASSFIRRMAASCGRRIRCSLNRTWVRMRRRKLLATESAFQERPLARCRIAALHHSFFTGTYPQVV